jgi:hypothetical protein
MTENDVKTLLQRTYYDNVDSANASEAVKSLRMMQDGSTLKYGHMMVTIHATLIT